MTIIIADLHVHSRFSRATSKNLDLINLEKWAKIKGLGLLGTGDFSHPLWMKELKDNLKEDGTGILKTKSGYPFMLSNEISLMYSQDGRGRRVHLLIFAPNFEIADQLTEYLKSHGRVDYDGRPIFNISCADFLDKVSNISKDIEIIPAHAWTPYFGVFGSKTGFDSMDEAFEDKANLIHALETGMSSDPAMNWRISKLDKYTLVSFSDAHSFWPWRLGREATAFNVRQFTYKEIIDSIRSNTIAFTIETSPHYGIYHYDGHRNCAFSCSPQEAKKMNNICPRCGRQLTIGVEHRVEDLADREEGFRPITGRDFFTLLPLSEIIALALKSPLESKKVMGKYLEMTQQNTEFDILLNLSAEEMRKIADDRLIYLIMLNRKGKIKVKPGYDGVYGEPVIEEQTRLF